MTRRDLLVSLLLAPNAPYLGVPRVRANQQRVLTSLIRLIARPFDFYKREVRVVGYLDFNGLDKSVGLYVSEVDGRNRIIPNSINLNRKSGTTLRQYLGKYVICNAKYFALGAEIGNGYFDDISGLQILPPVEGAD